LKRIFFLSFRKRIRGIHNLFSENPDDMNMEDGFYLSRSRKLWG
jgi:hypothetical protein